MPKQAQGSAAPPIYENYKDYQPPKFARPTIAKLLSEIPSNYLAGLESIVLTNAVAIGKGKTIRVKGRKFVRNQCRGFYHPQSKGQAPWIEIIVDNVLYGDLTSASAKDKMLARLPIAQQIVMAQTLYHEIGHHIDKTIGAPAPSGEAAAEAWKERLTVLYLRKHYWYIMPLIRLARPIVKAIRGSKSEKAVSRARKPTSPRAAQ